MKRQGRHHRDVAFLFLLKPTFFHPRDNLGTVYRQWGWPTQLDSATGSPIAGRSPAYVEWPAMSEQGKPNWAFLVSRMEPKGFEPSTYALRTRRSPI